MEFEDKFRKSQCNCFARLVVFVDVVCLSEYRLPMYTLLEFLWPIPSFRPCIESLAHQVCGCSSIALYDSKCVYDIIIVG